MTFFCKKQLSGTDLLHLEVLLALWQTLQEEEWVARYESFSIGTSLVTHVFWKGEGEWVFYAQLKEQAYCTKVRLCWHPRLSSHVSRYLDYLTSCFSRWQILSKVEFILSEKQNGFLQAFLLQNFYQEISREILLVFTAPKKLVRVVQGWDFKSEFRENLFTVNAYYMGAWKGKVSIIILKLTCPIYYSVPSHTSPEERRIILNNFISIVRQKELSLPLSYTHSLEEPAYLPIEALLGLGFQRVGVNVIWTNSL